jgi:uncharacterized membrane protein YeaQ/YmgE (transglycosylase-associated protein family)
MAGPTKLPIWVGMLIGSILGGYIPTLWGADIFSLTSLAGSVVGGLLGIWVGYKIGACTFS